MLATTLANGRYKVSKICRVCNRPMVDESFDHEFGTEHKYVCENIRCPSNNGPDFNTAEWHYDANKSASIRIMDIAQSSGEIAHMDAYRENDWYRGVRFALDVISEGLVDNFKLDE